MIFLNTGRDSNSNSNSQVYTRLKSRTFFCKLKAKGKDAPSLKHHLTFHPHMTFGKDHNSLVEFEVSVVRSDKGHIPEKNNPSDLLEG